MSDGTAEIILLRKSGDDSSAPGRAGTTPGRRVVMLQTQAEAAGAQEISRILGSGLAASGYDIHHVFCFRRTAAFDHQPGTFFCMRERPRNIIAAVRMLGVLVRHLKQVRPDAIVCFQHYGNIVGIVAARLSGTKAVIINRNSAKSLIPGWVRGLELVFGLAGWFQRLVVNSGAVEREYNRYPNRYRRRLVRIDHGFERKMTKLSSRESRNAFSLPTDVTLLGSAGRLHPTKNFDAAIRVLVGKDWHLALAGQGPAQGELVALAQRLGVADRVHFVGEVPPERIGDFLAALDVFVFPSTAETFGLAAVEAAQAGVPVVANGLDVMREVLAVGGRPCAVFVDVGNADPFAQAIERVLGDQNFRTELVARANKLSKRYCLDTMVARYAGLIEATVLRQKGSPKTHGDRRLSAR